MGARKLRADVIHVIGHAPQDGVDHRLLRIAAQALVAVQLLYPFEIDDGHHAHQQIDMPGHIEGRIGIAAVQTFVEHQIGLAFDRLPRDEGAGLLTVRRGLCRVVQILADLAFAVGAVILEQALEFGEQIRIRTEMAEVQIAVGLGLLHRRAHRLAVVAMEGIAFDDLRLELFTPEDVLKAFHHRRGAGARGAGHRDDRMLDGHGRSPCLLLCSSAAQARASGRYNERSLNKGET